jgi:hypothetical protein
MRIVPFVLALGLALSAHADAPAPYTSKALGFSARFPLAVKENVEADGSGTASAIDMAGVMYMVGMIPPSKEAAKKSVKEQLDDGIAGAIDKVHGTLASQKDVKLGKHPGREAEIALQGAHATFRFYIVDKKAYMIGVVNKDGVTPPLAPADFFASFTLVPAKK